LRKNHNDDDNSYIHQPCENYSPTLQLPQNHHSYSADLLVTVTWEKFLRLTFLSFAVSMRQGYTKSTAHAPMSRNLPKSSRARNLCDWMYRTCMLIQPSPIHSIMHETQNWQHGQTLINYLAGEKCTPIVSFFLYQKTWQ
jgi:hypothetical protein